MKKRFVSVLMTVFILCLAPLFVACTDDEGLDFTIGVQTSHMSVSNGHDITTTVFKLAELHAISDTRFYKVGSGDGAMENVYYLQDLTQKYDDTYFDNKALVLYLYTGNDTGTSVKICDLIRDDDTLIIKARQNNNSASSAQVITYWTYVLEVDKTDVEGVTNTVVLMSAVSLRWF